MNQLEVMKCMMGFIKSRFSGNTLFWGIFMFVFLIFEVLFIFKVLINYSFNISNTLILLFLICLFLFSANYLKNIRYVIIKGDIIKFYSILKPFGATLNTNDFSGKIILTETGSTGSYNVLYLVDKQNMTSLKIMQLHYKNFDEINDAIQIKIIKFNPTPSQYFRLLFFEKINVTNTIIHNNQIILTITKIFKIVVVIGGLLILIRFLFKTISQGF